jgi:hypothetical protein
MGESATPPILRFDRRLLLVFQLAEVAAPKGVFEGVLERIDRFCAAQGNTCA